jgi:hypothetical protein
MVSIQIRLLPDEAARLMRAIELGADRGSLADGAVALAETMLSGSSGADVAAGGASAIRPPVEVAVHISAANLEGVVPMLEDDSGKTIDVGRKTRSVPPALRRALNARDRTCRFPGCMHRRMLDAHHVRHWIDGGETKLSNLLNCCRRHHRYLHEYAFSAELRDGELVFLDPDGHQIPPVVMRAPLPDGSVDRLRAEIQQRGIEISAETNAPGWDGLPVDYDACVDAIGGWDPL